MIREKNYSNNFKRGTLELIVLHLLQNNDLYGYQITQAIKEKSNGNYSILEGSLYNILFRLTEDGYISNYIKQVGVKRKRRYYHMEGKGKCYYLSLLNDYDEVCRNVSKILGRDTEVEIYEKRLKERIKEKP